MSSAFEGLPKTPNLKLNKPGYDNVADIEALNENADILDEEIQGIKNTFVKSVNGINAGDGGNVDLGIMPISQGGTGANNASEACANIGALPTSGGIMTGRILFDNNNNQIAHTRNDARFTIYSGVDFGGRLGLYGSNHPTAAGQVVLTASISSEAHYSFVLDPTNREIKWDGEEVPSIAYKAMGFEQISQNVIRYRNGLQIIVGKVKFSQLTNGVINFIVPFLADGVMFFAFPLWGDASNVPKITANPITTTNVTVLVSEDCYFTFLVIGKWK